LVLPRGVKVRSQALGTIPHVASPSPTPQHENFAERARAIPSQMTPAQTVCTEVAPAQAARELACWRHRVALRRHMVLISPRRAVAGRRRERSTTTPFGGRRRQPIRLMTSRQACGNSCATCSGPARRAARFGHLRRLRIECQGARQIKVLVKKQWPQWSKAFHFSNC
jgi:hypothetical protein